MKISLYLTTSLNGLTTRFPDDTDWADDWDILTNHIKDAGLIVMDKRTYQFAKGVFPYDNALNVVLTHDQKLLTKKSDSKSLFLDKSPTDLVKYLSNLKYNKLLLIGGQKIIVQFFQENLIDEIFITISPHIFGDGKNMVKKSHLDCKLKLISAQIKNGLVELHYQVAKPVLTIRQFKVAEIPSIKNFLSKIFSEFGWKIESQYDSDLDDMIKFYDPADNSIFYVVTDDNNIIGTAGIKNKGNGIAEIKKMFLAPDHRGRGLGNKLLTQIINFCQDKKYQKIVLITDPQLKIAHKLYRKYGFSVTKIVKDDIHMSKLLN
jgi:dihydrofolate reductase/ribosomal protein S18 acetylase RimI-like enzyme